jgi:hypothetical protein
MITLYSVAKREVAGKENTKERDRSRSVTSRKPPRVLAHALSMVG